MAGQVERKEVIRRRALVLAAAIIRRAVAARISGNIIVAFALLVPLSACTEAEAPAGLRVVAGNSEAGRAVIAKVACGVCHSIPGVTGADGIVGPPLDDFGRRQFIAGRLPNRPGLLVRWIRDAPALVPETGMPEMPVTEEQALDVAAYLYTLR